MPLYKPFRHFTWLVFFILLATASLPCWSPDTVGLMMIIQMTGIVTLAFGWLGLVRWWSRTSLYWHFHVSRWADHLGMLASLILLAGVVLGARYISSLTWFHLSERQRSLFLLGILVWCVIWLAEAVADLALTSREMRRILRSPFGTKRGDRREK